MDYKRKRPKNRRRITSYGGISHGALFWLEMWTLNPNCVDLTYNLRNLVKVN